MFATVSKKTFSSHMFRLDGLYYFTKCAFRSILQTHDKNLIDSPIVSIVSPTTSSFRLSLSTTACVSSAVSVTPKTIKETSNQDNKTPYSNPFDPDLVENLLNRMDGDMPISDMPDPFAKKYHRCFICRHNVQLDHKNVRLLSQFVSPYTGRIYGRAVTGLCIPMQKHVAKLIKRARNSAYMPVILKDPKYLHDPQPYDPMSRK